jgi:hypothetical protein
MRKINQRQQLMKTIVSLVSVITTLAMSSAMAQTTYNGTSSALGGGGNGTAISSVVVNNTATDITFTINSTQSQAFLMYGIELQIIGQAANGYTGFVNPFGPQIGISTGENALIDTFGTGATAFTANNAGFSSGTTVGSFTGGTGNTFATITTSLSSLGLSIGQSFYLDVISTFTAAGAGGGGQSAYNALDSTTGFPAESNGNFTPSDGVSHYDSATDANINFGGASDTDFGMAANMYTIVVPAPEPTTCALIGLGALTMISRVRRNAK